MWGSTILAISLLVSLMPILKAEEWSSIRSSDSKRQRRQDSTGWSWTYVDAFGTTTYNAQVRQEFNYPRESISKLPKGINISGKLDIFSKLFNTYEVSTNDAPPETVNVSPETVNVSLEAINNPLEIKKLSPVKINFSPQNNYGLPETINTLKEIETLLAEKVKFLSKLLNFSPETIKVSPELVNALPETVNISPETLHILPETVTIPLETVTVREVNNSQETINVSERIQPVVETPIIKSPNEPQAITESTDTRMILSEQQVTTEPAETTTEENPCERPEPEVPDFSAPGRRKSEIKCYEYIWEMKKRILLAENRKECLKYLASRGIYYGFGVFGLPAKDGEFPHMGAIGWISSQGNGWEFKCGGSLISPKFLLTAAHCTRASKLDTTIADPVPKIVRLHDTRITNDGGGGVGEGEGERYRIDTNITKIISHPQYKSPMKYYDIALMELAEIQRFDKYMQPACLWTKSDTSSLGTGATATGWGVTETSRAPSPVLIAVKVKFVDYQQCDDLLTPLRNRHFRGLENHQLCAGNLAGGADACQGDSGGPLQVPIPLPNSTEGVMHYVVGVTSFGYGCGLANKPGIYTRVSSFVDWIEDIVWR